MNDNQELYQAKTMTRSDRSFFIKAGIIKRKIANRNATLYYNGNIVNGYEDKPIAIINFKKSQMVKDGFLKRKFKVKFN